MIVGDVTDDGEAEAGTTGVAAAGPIDAIEPLEDAIEVAGGDADAPIGDVDRDAVVAPDGGHPHLAAGLAVLDGVVDEVADGRDQLASVAEHTEAHRLVDVDADVALLGAGQRPDGGVADDHRDVDRIAHGAAAEFDARQLEQIVDRRRGTVCLVDHLVRETLDHLGVVLVGQRLGQYRQCAHRCLQLVADVGDEVGTYRIESSSLADVVDGDQHTAVGQGDGAHEDGLLRRSEQLDRRLRFATLECDLHVSVDGVLHQHVTVSSRPAHPAVAADHRAIGIDQHDAQRQAVEHRLSALEFDAEAADLEVVRARGRTQVVGRCGNDIPTAMEEAHGGRISRFRWIRSRRRRAGSVGSRPSCRGSGGAARHPSARASSP